MDLLDEMDRLVKENASLRMEAARLAVGTDRVALRAPAAARYLGISPRKLADLRKREVIPYALIDDIVVYPTEALKDFVDKRTVRHR